MITTDYVPLKKEYELVSFDDDEFELTGRTIMGFRSGRKIISWYLM